MINWIERAEEISKKIEELDKKLDELIREAKEIEEFMEGLDDN